MTVGLNFYTIWEWTATKQATKQSIIADSRRAVAVLCLAKLRTTSDNSPKKLQHWTISPSRIVGISKTHSLLFISSIFLPLSAVLCSSHTLSASEFREYPSLLTLRSMNWLNVDGANRLQHSRHADLHPIPRLLLFHPPPQIFRGNVDNNTPSAGSFTPPIEAQYVRIYPQVCRRHCTLRMELLGCELSGRGRTLSSHLHETSDKEANAVIYFLPTVATRLYISQNFVPQDHK